MDRAGASAEWILFAAAAASIASTSVWLVRAEFRTAREKRAYREALHPPIEVIPLERWKPPGLGEKPGKRRQRIVMVSKRRVRKVSIPPPSVIRRKTLGLGSITHQGMNRRLKISSWAKRRLGQPHGRM